jgi:hypothetical protein
MSSEEYMLIEERVGDVVRGDHHPLKDISDLRMRHDA